MPQYQGVWTLQNAAQLQSTQRWVTDPLFENTTLLLQADSDVTAAQNNTFLDSSSNSFVITRNGNTTQGTFTPFSLQPGAWSTYFPGASSLIVPAGSAFAYGTGAFTVEAWINPYTYQAGSSTGGQIISQTTSGQNYFVVQLGAAGELNFTFGSGGGTTISTAPGSIPLGIWTHVAVVREGTGASQLKLYVNGFLLQSGTCSFNFTDTTYNPTVGNYTHNSTQLPFGGYISNLRVVKGVVVYTGNFTPSSLPLAATQSAGINTAAITGTQTSLLTAQSNRFLDNSVANAGGGWTVTLGGTPSIQAFSPFAPQFQWTPSVIGGSAYFDGTGDYLDSASNAALQLGSGDFSIEWWEYRDVVAAEDTPVSTGSYSSAYASCLLGYGGTAGLISTNGSSWNVLNAPAYIDTLNAKSWNHFVYTRSGTAFRVFMNGKLSNYATGSGSVVQNNNTFSVGGNAGGGQFHMPGYISGFRVVKGSIPTSYQTSSTTPGTVVFTPPTAPPTTTSQGATANNVGLVLNSTNAGIYDGTMKNNLETTGNVSVNTNVVKYGSGSIFFDGTGDYLTIPNVQQIVGTINTTTTLTIECWIYPTARPAFLESGLIGDMNPTASTNYWSFGPNQNGFLTWYSFSNATQTATSTLIPLNTWTHIAVSIQSGRIRLFVNGILQAFTGDAALTGTSGSVGYLTMGQWSNSTNYAYFGYVDDLRITRGVARYITSFTPPTVALPRQ